MKVLSFQKTILVIGMLFLAACSDSSSGGKQQAVALLFVGHGEPAACEDGDVPIAFADGTSFGPHGADLGVPEGLQHTEWAAAYEEIATAMTYIFPDLNANSTPHELGISPAGDVPPFFTWDAFHSSVYEHYQAFSNYSPHNDTLAEHVESLDIKVKGARIDTYLAYLDAVPRIPDVIHQITDKDKYQKLVVVPMLLASSTHTQEVEAFIRETAGMTSDMDVVVSEPFFEIPYMRNRIKEAVIAMADDLRQAVPADVEDKDIGVLLASHGTPYAPPFEEFGWHDGEIFSNLIPTEDVFHHEIEQELPWRSITGRMNYASPSIEDSLAALDAEGFEHVMVVPSAFPTAAMHTMWDVPQACVEQAVVPQDGVVVHTRLSGMKVYYSAKGFADTEPGCSEFRKGLAFIGQIGVMEALEMGSDDGDSNGTTDDDTNDGTGSGDTDDDDTEIPDDDVCLPGEICVTVTAGQATGSELRLMLYETETDEWPRMFRSLPTPSWVVTEYPPVPDTFPVHIRIPLAENLFAISSEPLEGARLGLAIATGVASIMVVEPTDARGFSETTLVYQPDAVMDFGDIELAVPQGDACELNPYHPGCLTGPLFWKEHFLGEVNFVPGAVYMDVADIDGDGTDDIVMVGEPHFEDPNLPLTVLKLGIYYLNKDFSVRDSEIIDAWSETNPDFYSPWGVNVIDHGGEPMIIVGTNIPGLAPLEEGSGAIFSYRNKNGVWERSAVMTNPNPTEINYNAMIVVTSDMDNDGDEDLVLSGAFGSSAVGSWMENTGQEDPAWIPHLQTMAADTDPYIRGTLAYKSTDLNGDGYPEIMYNAMFDIANTNPPRYRGEIWLGINPGPDGWDEPWQKVIVDDDNWASADMWFHDFDGDGYPDLIANQIFSSTVTRYRHPGENLDDPWVPEIIISGLTSPSDMWLADMDADGLVDVVSADHTAHRGVWHKNPGPDSTRLWKPNLIYRNIRMPGDFFMKDFDEDGDLDWLGTSMTRGQAFIIEQVEPAAGLVATISLPAGFNGKITKLMLTLAREIPVTGIPAAILATIDNVDKDGDGLLDVDQILSPGQDLVLAIDDIGVSGAYYVVVTLYVEGGGQFQPVPGVDYLAASGKLSLGSGLEKATLNLIPYSDTLPPEPVALLFVGHGEPSVCEDGDVAITLADGSDFGPFGMTLNVPEASQNTEWAAAYEEIATAMTYIFPDLNANGMVHELAISPAGDVPPFFTWEAFHTTVYDHYYAFNNYSPHNDSLAEHVNSMDIQLEGAEVDTYLAYLDAVPRIPDKIFEIMNENQYRKLVVVPMLFASSTHTQEVENFIEETAHMTGGMDVVVCEPFFAVPEMRTRLKNAVIAMADYVRQSIPADVADQEIGVVLASHGTPYVSPTAESGWQEGEIFSYLIPTEDAFHDEISQELTWNSHTGRMNYSSPTIEDALTAFEAEGATHVMVIPSAFPTTAMHTMWDVAQAATEQAVLPADGVVTFTRPSGMRVYYSAQGFADIEPGQTEFRDGLRFIGEKGVVEVLK